MSRAGRFTADPNLPPGRVTKAEGGMQDVLLSRQNLVLVLVLVLDALHTATTAELSATGARCRTLYDRSASFTAKLDPGAPPGRTTGILCRIDDSLHTRYVGGRPSGGTTGRGTSARLLRRVPSPAPATR